MFTVARLLQEVQQQLESGFGTVWLQGELSNVSRPGSGHLYFSIKDSRAQIRCAMFKGRNSRLDFEPAHGDAVLVRGTLGLYAARGDFQLIVDHMEPVGAGQLQAAFERTKRELDELGWFSTETKRRLPSMPASIGVVTSPTGAALRDVLHVLQRRYPQAEVVLYPTQTQGIQAASGIVKAIEQASRRQEVDVLLVVRGGGSLEDLWGFNERSVAAALRGCAIPTVSGVGHEVDITITDLVADLRAPTPSAAAELATPDSQALRVASERQQRNLVHAMQRRLDDAQRTLKSMDIRLAARQPRKTLAARARHVDELDQRLNRATLQLNRQRALKLGELTSRLHARHPRRSVSEMTRRHESLHQRLVASMGKQLTAAHSRLQPAERALHAVGPRAVLARGYALLNNDKGLVTRVSDITKDSSITATLVDGDIVTRVESVRRES